MTRTKISNKKPVKTRTVLKTRTPLSKRDVKILDNYFFGRGKSSKKILTEEDLLEYLLDTGNCLDISILEETCSMKEISFYASDFEEWRSIFCGINKNPSEKLKLKMFCKLVEYEIKNLYKRKTCYITNVINGSFYDKAVIATKLFKKVHSYQGSDGRVNTYILI